MGEQQIGHDDAFHEALDRLAVVTRLVDEGVPHDDLPARAVASGLAERDARLLPEVLQEGCGWLVAEELGVHPAADVLVRYCGEETVVPLADFVEFHAARELARMLRTGGRNDLFKALASGSATLATLSSALDQGADVAGATCRLTIFWDEAPRV